MAINITELQLSLINCPKQIMLLNEMYYQIKESNFSEKVSIKLPPYLHFSSKLKKRIIHLLGYRVNAKKLSNEFEIFLV